MIKTHTSRPWTVTQAHAAAAANAYDRGQVYVISAPTWAALALVAMSGRRGEANAHLIAAAPEYWDAAEALSRDYWALSGEHEGFVAIPTSKFDALMAAHAKARTT